MTHVVAGWNVTSGAKRDGDGYLWITGRIDDMLNVSGHLLSTADVESVLIEHPLVAETAVVAHPHPIKGECLYCFVTLKDVRITSCVFAVVSDAAADVIVC